MKNMKWLEVEEAIHYLPDECWAEIFRHLTMQSDWESICLVSKRFLSIFNSSRLSISLINPNMEILPKLLHRFSSLKKISVIGKGDLPEVVIAIARSGLRLEALNLTLNGKTLDTVCLENLGSNLKVLKLSDCPVSNADLGRIANYFPLLEELRIGIYSSNIDVFITDEGKYLLAKLKKLRIMGLSVFERISDKFLISFSSNCVFLEHFTVVLYEPCDLTENGISFLINNCLHLTSFNFYSMASQLATLKRCYNFPKNLKTLDFHCVGISDEFLYSIAKARIPLTELTLTCCQGYSFSGFSKLLHSCQSLKILELGSTHFLTNEHIEFLAKFLHRLTTIKLQDCPELSDSGFLTLTRKLPLLCHLQMSGTSLGKEEFCYDGVMENFKIKYLDLSSNLHLSSSGARSILNICPKVEKLLLNNCFRDSDHELDVADVLECNRELVFLNLGRCSLKFTRKDVGFSKLETLVAFASELNDQVLAMIARMCPRLVCLNLGLCRNLTEVGVKEVVKSCRRLRYLNLIGCGNVDASIIPSIVCNSPSLTRLFSPSRSYPDEEMRKHFSQQGCLVRLV